MMNIQHDTRPVELLRPTEPEPVRKPEREVEQSPPARGPSRTGRRLLGLGALYSVKKNENQVRAERSQFHQVSSQLHAQAWIREVGEPRPVGCRAECSSFQSFGEDSMCDLAVSGSAQRRKRTWHE